MNQIEPQLQQYSIPEEYEYVDKKEPCLIITYGGQINQSPMPN